MWELSKECLVLLKLRGWALKSAILHQYKIISKTDFFLHKWIQFIEFCELVWKRFLTLHHFSYALFEFFVISLITLQLWRLINYPTKKGRQCIRHSDTHSDTQKICCNPPKVQLKWLYHRVMHPKDADGLANSVDPDQTRSSLIWVCTVCPDLSVRKLRKIKLSTKVAYRNDPKFPDRQVWANISDPDQTAQIYTVCNSVCIFCMYYSVDKPSCSNCRVIAAKTLGVRIFRIFTVFNPLMN